MTIESNNTFKKKQHTNKVLKHPNWLEYLEPAVERLMVTGCTQSWSVAAV